MNSPLEEIPIVRPALPSLADIQKMIEPTYAAGRVTLGPTVRELETEVSAYLGGREVVAVNSATSGLIFAYRALELPPGGEVICPSFTFAATAHAVVWNRLVPVFVDCRPDTFTIDPKEIERAITERTVAISPTNIFGVPPDYDAIAAIAASRRLAVVCDSAQGLGSIYKGVPGGAIGHVEVFSMSPTKVISAIEGGLIATGDPLLARRFRSLRDYGKADAGPEAGEDMNEIGLSARMSEFHAAVGLLNFRRKDELIAVRRRRIDELTARLGLLPNIQMQTIPDDRITSGNYFVILLTSTGAKDRDHLKKHLAAAGIQTKRYFYPPVHRQTAQQHFPLRIVGDLANTERISSQALALPLYHSITDAEIDRIVAAISSF